MTDVLNAVLASLEAAGLGDVLHAPGSETYNSRIESYWSLTPRLKPWAIVQPRSTAEVSAAIKATVDTPGCKFAIRSGGHTCWPGSNSIEDGVTIDLGLMNSTTYNPESKLASLQPGQRWTDVYARLEEQGVMVAGGREGLVGVGGLLVGGGKTFYTCRVGFACDQVVNYEVVLADGSIVEANAETNADLFRVLKGGSNNFGVVTRFDMVTFPAHDIWDGHVIYPKTATDELLSCFADFTKSLPEHPNDPYLGLWTYSPQAKDIFIMSMITNLDAVEHPTSFRKLLSIPGVQGVEGIKRTTIAKKVASFLLPSNRYDTWFSLTFKLDPWVLKRTTEIYESFVDEVKELIPDGDFIIYMVLQPLPASFAKHSVDCGNNMVGLDRVHEDSVLLIASVDMNTKEHSRPVVPRFKAAIDQIESYAISVDANVEFRYLNYCDGSQNPLGTYGAENIKKMKDAAAKYDPTGVFQTRVPGGFKISKV